MPKTMTLEKRVIVAGNPLPVYAKIPDSPHDIGATAQKMAMRRGPEG